MTSPIRAGIAAALVLLWAAVAAAAALAPPGAAELAAHVAALTAPEMEGRGSATAGGERAARYLAEQLAAMGLVPAGEGGGYLQSFPVGIAMRIGPDSALERTGTGPGALVAGRDWTPHGGSPAADVTAEVLLLGRDGYAGTDPRGKIVLAEEAGDRPASRLDQLIEARRHGAAALLLIGDRLPSLEASGTAVRIPSGTLSRGAAAALLAPTGGTRTDAGESGAPPAGEVGLRLRLRVGLEQEERRAANVIGILPGTDPALASEAVILGAHYDHLGRVDGVVHPGADDNASGSAVVLGLARAFAAAGGAPRTLVFAFFSGEEMGLLGSAHYARHPAVPLARTVAMLNFDMVGRARDGRFHVGGLASGTGLRALVQAVAEGARPGPDLLDSPHGPSDHASLYSAGVPVVFFHTGTHADYHLPGDTADKIDAAGMAEVARVGSRLAARLAGEPRPLYVAVPPPPASAPRMSGGDPGSAFLGISGSPHAEADGLALGSVVPGSAAAQAGLRGGDVIVRVDDVPIGRFEDLRQFIARKRPGDTVSILYLRDGEDQRITATLGARP